MSRDTDMNSVEQTSKSALLAGVRRRHGYLAGRAVLIVFGLLIMANVWVTVRNQRELPKRLGPRGMDDWFHISDRDIERVARRHPRHTIYGRSGIYYFLGQKIHGVHLTIPNWLSWLEWEFERVSRTDVTVADTELIIDSTFAKYVRQVGERRQFARYSSKRSQTVGFYLLYDASATRYVMAESPSRREMYVVAEAEFQRHAEVLSK